MSPGDHTEVVEVSRRTFTLAGLLFSITAFLSKKNQKALLILKFLLPYSLRVVCEMAVTSVLSLRRQESLWSHSERGRAGDSSPAARGSSWGFVRYFGVTLK